MIKPYYEEDGITLYNADCRDVLPQLEPVDLVTMVFRTKTFAGKYRGEDKDSRLATVKELKSSGASLREIKEKTGLDKSYISRLLAGKENRTVAVGRYLADYELSKALEVLGV